MEYLDMRPLMAIQVTCLPRDRFQPACL